MEQEKRIKFFENYKDDFAKIFKELAKSSNLSESLQTVKEMINDWYDPEHIKATKQKITEKLKQLDDDKVDKIIKIIEESNHEKLGQSITIMAITIILLYRQGYLSELSHNPASFIKKIITDIFPFKELLSLEDDQLTLGFSSLLMNIASKDWQSIAHRVFAGISVMHWKDLDLSIDQDFKLSSILNKIMKKNIEERKAAITPQVEPGTYQHYISKLNQKLQNRYMQPDLVLIDSILVAEYKAKGVFGTIGNFIKREERGAIQIPGLVDKEIEQLGRTIDGYLEAIPITRNFHLPGYAKEFEKKHVDIAKNLDKSIDIFIGPSGENDWEKIFENSPFANHEEYFKFENINTDNLEEFNSSFKNSFNKKHHSKMFFLYMGDQKPFIPMQLARGAHVVYSFFAYTNGAIEEIKPFLFVSKSEEDDQIMQINIVDSEALQEQLYYFLALIYKYVPAISLCLDQKYSAKVRENDLYFKDWFDPCLPIESSKFQSGKIEYKEQPINGVKGAPLSCLGGYCFTVTQNSDAVFDASDLALELSQKYYNAVLEKYMKNDLVNDNIPNDYNCRIRYNIYNKALLPEKERKKLEELEKEYRTTPKNIAKRPHFYGWHILEEQISNVTRLYIAAIILYRSVVAKISKSDSKQFKIKEMPIESNPDFAKKYVNEDMISNYLSFTKLSVINSLINMYENNDKTKNEIINWVNLNYDPLIADSNVIASLIQLGIQNDEYIKASKNPDENRFDKFISILSKHFHETLIRKLVSSCLANDWKPEKIET